MPSTLYLTFYPFNKVIANDFFSKRYLWNHEKTAGLIYLLLSLVFFTKAQTVKELQQTARDFFKQGDFNNAILVLNKAHDQEPNNLSVSKDIALAYFQKSDYPRMQGTLKPLLERSDADAEVFQLAGMLNKTIGDFKDCEQIYKKGLKNFPDSGPLLSDYGELLWANKEFTNAIKQWEHGIEADQTYTGNYYNAARYYYFSKDKVWSLIYGELFVNMESFSRRTVEIKSLLTESYKKFFTDADIMKNQDTKNPFAVAFLNSMARQASVAKSGITTESLTMIRSRFIIDWFEKEATKFPFRLFEYQRQLLKEGTFDAYNQWLFGSVQDLPAFEAWTKSHSDEYEQFTTAQGNRMFKVVKGQYYQTIQK